MSSNATRSGRSTPQSGPLLWLPVVLAEMAALAGYFGPWIGHRTAGLTLGGIDLAEFVQFLPEVMSGQISFRRELFYLPLVAGSITVGLLAGRRALPGWARLLCGIAAVPLALALLPPAWAPASLLLPPYWVQSAAIAVCLAVALLFFLTQFAPNWLVLLLIGVLALIAAVLPAWCFLQVRPAISAIYRAAPPIGWGFWLCSIGNIGIAFLAVVGTLRRR